MEKVKEKVAVGVVGGSDLAKISEQLGGSISDGESAHIYFISLDLLLIYMNSFLSC